jgi:hypothetical protein
MKVSILIVFYALSASFCAHAAETYTCPKLAAANGHAQRASYIDLYSGPPSEMAQLKPDNADTDDTNPPYWLMSPSKYDYWFVCNYATSKSKREFKLPKNYKACTNLGSDKALDRLKCK